MYIVRARAARSSLSVGTDSPEKALDAWRQFVENGMNDVTVLSETGDVLSRQELEMRAGADRRAA